MIEVAAPAKLYGEPLLEMPADLYIPPKALSVLLTAFEGPLDLLLYLIRKSNIDILDIPMASLTAQYLRYIEAMDENFELAADYLAMAAYLIEIKSRLLLPKPPAVLAEEVEDPRAELVRRLVEYEAMKKNAEAINALPRRDRDFFVARVFFEKAPPVLVLDLADFQKAWARVLENQKINAAHEIEAEIWSVRAKMAQILTKLSAAQYALRFEALIEEASPSSLIVHFVAVLELARECAIDIAQESPFSPIYIAQVR